jgi:hypothetical protein
MKAVIGLGLALALLVGCASAARPRPPARDKPLDETKTYGPSHVVWIR